MRTIRKAALAAAVALLCQGHRQPILHRLVSLSSIEQQPLRTALKSLADQTGLQIMRREEDAPADGIMAPRLRGRCRRGGTGQAARELGADVSISERPDGADRKGRRGERPLVLAQSRPRETEEAAARQDVTRVRSTRVAIGSRLKR